MILGVLLFLLGVQLMMELLAALYGYIDLAYRLKDYWLGITAKVLLITGLITGIAAGTQMLAPESLTSYLYGLGFYLAFHIIIFWLGRAALFILERND